MNRRYVRSHLSDQAVMLSLSKSNSQELTATADLLADLAEVDARKLYRPAGYSSMFAYCVDPLRRSEVAAYKRIRAARAARRFPVIFEMLADGRLLAPYLPSTPPWISWPRPRTRRPGRSSGSWPGASRGRTCRPGSSRFRRRRPTWPRPSN